MKIKKLLIWKKFIIVIIIPNGGLNYSIDQSIENSNNKNNGKEKIWPHPFRTARPWLWSACRPPASCGPDENSDPPSCTATSCSEKHVANNPDRFKLYFETSIIKRKTAGRGSLAIMAEFEWKHKTSLVQDSSTGRLCRSTVCISGLTLFSQSHNDFYRF